MTLQNDIIFIEISPALRLTVRHNITIIT